MTVLVLDPYVEQRLLAERVGSDGDRYDEVWEGVYIMTPLPNDEHQEIVSALHSVLHETVAWPRLGKVRAGVNLSDRDEGWKENFREPDVAVFLRDTKAISHGTHWQGAADFLVEIISPGLAASAAWPSTNDVVGASLADHYEPKRQENVVLVMCLADVVICTGRGGFVLRPSPCWQWR